MNDEEFEYSQFLIGCTCEHEIHGWGEDDGCEECSCIGRWEE